jgi:uroporphyrinogen decarboxylase
MRFEKPDKVPVQYYYAPVGYYEHGDKLNDLYSGLPGDFAPFRRVEVPVVPAADLERDGTYHAFKRDEWGTEWEYRIFGIAGIPHGYPLADEERIKDFAAPTIPAVPSDLASARKKAFAARTDGFFRLESYGSLYERLIALRPDADVLCDIISDEPYIHELADKITAYYAAHIKQAVANGADGIAFGDDYGTERGLLMSRQLWRSFFFPRLNAMFKPARDAGMFIHFHSCGYIWDLLPDFAELGVTSVWPQLPAYDLQKLAARCREFHLAAAIHTDRARTMTSGTPKDVRELVLREYDTFKLYDGGGWFYIEADNGFPYANLEALVKTVKELRG